MNSPDSRWHTVVVPAAIGIEKFFWRLAWFSLFVGCVYSYLHRGLPAPIGSTPGMQAPVANEAPVTSFVLPMHSPLQRSTAGNTPSFSN